MREELGRGSARSSSFVRGVMSTNLLTVPPPISIAGGRFEAESTLNLVTYRWVLLVCVQGLAPPRCRGITHFSPAFNRTDLLRGAVRGGCRLHGLSGFCDASSSWCANCRKFGGGMPSCEDLRRSTSFLKHLKTL